MIIVSYFSYKGGAGRSSLTYNTITYLAKNLHATPEHPLIVMDMDVDSAGLTFLLDKGAPMQNPLTVNRLTKAITTWGEWQPEDRPIHNHEIFRQLAPVGIRFGLDYENNNSILFMPNEPNKNLGSSENNYSMDATSENRLDSFLKLCKTYNCVGVVLDTPAGNQATANWAVRKSDTIVTCMRITTQFQNGTINYLNDKLSEVGGKRFVIVPNAVPTEPIEIDKIPVDYDFIKENLHRRLEEVAQNHTSSTIDLRMLGKGEEFFGVNEVKSFKIKERILFNITENNLSDDERHAREMYKKIAAIIAEG